VFYSMWNNVPKLLSVGGAVALQTTDRQQFGYIVPHAVNHILALLTMGIKLPETCRADWKINKLSLHLVGPLHYLFGTFGIYSIAPRAVNYTFRYSATVI